MTRDEEVEEAEAQGLEEAEEEIEAEAKESAFAAGQKDIARQCARQIRQMPKNP
jgi:hypothetical protein